MTLKVPNEEGELKEATEVEFFDYISGYSPVELTEQKLKKAIYQLNEENFYFSQKMAGYMSNRNLNHEALKCKFFEEKKDLFGERVLRSLTFSHENSYHKERNLKVATKMRGNNHIR